jgi:glycerophosphoryl diester phosphodiesterase
LAKVPDVIAIAHRGDPMGARENTPAAFSSAAALGADWVELDLRLTGDGEVVVLHDQSLQRLWGRDVSVGDIDLAEVQRLGRGDERIPTLAEVLAASPLPLMIDFTRREVVAGALDAVRAADALERSLFVTGNVEALRQLRHRCRDARIGLTWVEGTEPPVGLLDELAAEYWNPMFGLVTPAGVESAHEMGKKVSTWTVDRHDDMERVMQSHVDAVVSNRIGDLLRFLGRR